jgi:hypothetical protein
MTENERISGICYERRRKLNTAGCEWPEGKDEDRRGRGKDNEKYQSLQASGVEHKKPCVHRKKQNCTQALWL